MKRNRIASVAMKLLSVGIDAKTKKGQKFGYMTGVMYLAPSNESKVINTCPHASAGCRAACLFTAGRGAFSPVRQARINKTILFKRDKAAFMAFLKKDIDALIKKAHRNNMVPVVRLNGTSDLPWENIRFEDGKNIMESFPDIQFYDYTKNFERMVAFVSGKMPENYHLTFSRSESNQAEVLAIMAKGGNIAAVFNPLPAMEGKFIDGDESDLRFLDKKNSVVVLKAKGKAKKDKSGFVVSPENFK